MGHRESESRPLATPAVRIRVPGGVPWGAARAKSSGFLRDGDVQAGGGGAWQGGARALPPGGRSGAWPETSAGGPRAPGRGRILDPLAQRSRTLRSGG